jgi:Cu(I)/Ag(I) efflux system periplasmic protein CusF
MRKLPIVFISTLVLFSALLPLRAFAASDMTPGQVMKIDGSAGKITLKHGPMKKFNMDEGMTMVYQVQDPAMLSRVKVGDKVQFDADQVNGVFTVTKIQKAK